MAENKARRSPRGHTSGPITFPARMRILTSSEYGRVFKKNTRSKDACFTVLAHDHGGSQPRLGMAIARKNAGNAVQRNRLKRLVRETFRLSQGSLRAADFVVLARPGVARRPNGDLISSLNTHWSRFSATRKREMH